MILMCGTCRYKAYGLHVASDLLIPELVPDEDSSATPEVSIVLGKVPGALYGAVEKNDIYQVTRNEYLLRIPKVAGYYVTNGDRIIVEIHEQSESRDARQFLLSTAFVALLLQRQIMVMHASAVVMDGRCVLFTGEPGVGKSTLAVALREQGYSILADDVASMAVGSNGDIMVQPGYPQQKLSRSSADAVGVDISCGVSVVSGSIKDKYIIPADNAFSRSSASLVAIYELTVGVSRKASITRLASADKLRVVIKGTWCRLIDVLGHKTEHFNCCLEIVGRVAVSRLSRPRGVFSLGDQIGLVQEDLGRLIAG